MGKRQEELDARSRATKRSSDALETLSLFLESAMPELFDESASAIWFNETGLVVPPVSLAKIIRWAAREPSSALQLVGVMTL